MLLVFAMNLDLIMNVTFFYIQATNIYTWSETEQ